MLYTQSCDDLGGFDDISEIDATYDSGSLFSCEKLAFEGNSLGLFDEEAVASVKAPWMWSSSTSRDTMPSPPPSTSCPTQHPSPSCNFEITSFADLQSRRLAFQSSWEGPKQQQREVIDLTGEEDDDEPACNPPGPNISELWAPRLFSLPTPDGSIQGDEQDLSWLIPAPHTSDEPDGRYAPGSDPFLTFSDLGDWVVEDLLEPGKGTGLASTSSVTTITGQMDDLLALLDTRNTANAGDLNDIDEPSLSLRGAASSILKAAMAPTSPTFPRRPVPSPQATQAATTGSPSSSPRKKRAIPAPISTTFNFSTGGGSRPDFRMATFNRRALPSAAAAAPTTPTTPSRKRARSRSTKVNDLEEATAAMMSLTRNSPSPSKRARYLHPDSPVKPPITPSRAPAFDLSRKVVQAFKAQKAERRLERMNKEGMIIRPASLRREREMLSLSEGKSATAAVVGAAKTAALIPDSTGTEGRVRRTAERSPVAPNERVADEDLFGAVSAAAAAQWIINVGSAPTQTRDQVMAPFSAPAPCRPALAAEGAIPTRTNDDEALDDSAWLNDLLGLPVALRPAIHRSGSDDSTTTRVGDEPVMTGDWETMPDVGPQYLQDTARQGVDGVNMAMSMSMSMALAMAGGDVVQGLGYPPSLNRVFAECDLDMLLPLRDSASSEGGEEVGLQGVAGSNGVEEDLSWLVDLVG